MVDTAADVSGALVTMESNGRVADGVETQPCTVMMGGAVDAQVRWGRLALSWLSCACAYAAGHSAASLPPTTVALSPQTSSHTATHTP